MTDAYDPDNLLDRRTAATTLQAHYDHAEAREAALLTRHLGLTGGTAVSVGCGWRPGRHLFPAPAWRLLANDLRPERAAHAVASGAADAAARGSAAGLDLPDASVDAVLERLVLHHVAYEGSVAGALAEAARVLRPGGALVAVEPNAWHPVGAALAGANRLGLGPAVHGTADDIPLSPRALAADARAAGLAPEILGVTYSWRRLPRGLQRALHALDAPLGARPRSAALAHTILLIGRKPVLSAAQ